MKAANRFKPQSGCLLINVRSHVICTRATEMVQLFSIIGVLGTWTSVTSAKTQQHRPNVYKFRTKYIVSNSTLLIGIVIPRVLDSYIYFLSYLSTVAVMKT